MNPPKHRREQIRNANPQTAEGRIWRLHALAALEALESAEGKLEVLQRTLERLSVKP